MKNRIYIESSLEEAFRKNKDLFIEHAKNQAFLFEQSATHSCDKMEDYAETMIDEFNRLIKQKFFLFWWERRQFFWKLYHLRFFRFQVIALEDGRLVLTFKEYAQETGDHFSTELYKDTLPDIITLHEDALRGVVGRQRQLINQISQTLH